MRYEYAIFNFLVVMGPVVAAKFIPGTVKPKIAKVWPAVLAVAAGFWLWDHIVTGWWWEFNSKYVLGWKIGNLPIEEIMFFVSVPYACLFLWENIKKGWGMVVNVNYYWKWTWIGALVLALFVALNSGWWYSAVVWAGWAVVLAGEKLTGTHLFEKRIFWIFIVVVGGMTTVWNGYLTARPIVIYNQEVKSGFQLGTIPIEDYFFGWILVTLVVMGYESNMKGLEL